MLGVNFDGIPGTLKEIPRWLVWKDDKVPHNARTGKPTGVTWERAGSPFSAARNAYETGEFRGVGFIIGPPIVGIDLDHCMTDGQPDDKARDILHRLFSYSELSPSGNGLHILVRGQIPANRQTRGIEVYGHSKYLTITGHVLDNRYFADIKDGSGLLEDLYQRISKTAAMPSVSAIPGPRKGNGYLRRTDEQVVRMIQTKGNAACKALWYGAWSDLYSSQSEADIALVKYLWYWSNEYEPRQVDRLFRQSGLMRDKWDELIYGTERTYGWWTISKVVGVDDEDSRH